MEFEADAGFAEHLDAIDPLSEFRDRFIVPSVDGESVVYLVGNSLGLQPRKAQQILNEEMKLWAEKGVAGHFDQRRPWVDYHTQPGVSMASLVGARPAEVVLMNTLTVNLHLLMISFYQPTANRHKILIEDRAFPSDHFAVESQIAQRGFDPATSLATVHPRPGEDTLHTADILDAINELGPELALVLLPGIQYYTGQVLAMSEIVAAAHGVGARVGFDLAHAIGNVEMSLHDWGVDFAAWCTYKYLNAGPGAIAGAFVHERHLSADLPRLQGWWGHELASRFEMETEFRPEPSADAWSVSNAPILSMAPIVASMEIFDEVGMPALREKSRLQSGYMDYLLGVRLPGKVESITPIHPEERGCQLSLRVIADDIDGRQVYERLQASNVACDWRYPAVVRVAPTPLYNTFSDIYRFVEILDEIVGT
ncbi:MAG: kynureninase [Acidimicrobiia bacterium]|nr:kynureninase [Acidimicrobiia bacterium]